MAFVPYRVIQGLEKGIKKGKLLVSVAPETASRERSMRKWYVPLTVVGLGSLGAFFLIVRGKSALHWIMDNFHRAPGKFLEWNETAQQELDRIQAALNHIAETVEPRRELGS